MSWWHAVQQIVPTLSTSDTSRLTFYSQRRWPSAATGASASAGDLYLAEQILLEMEKGRGHDSPATKTTIVRIMNEHLVNASWYAWLRPQLVALITPTAPSPTEVDSVGKMMRPDFQRFSSLLRDSVDAWLVQQAVR